MRTVQAVKQQVIVLLVPFDEGNPDGVPESWDWDDIGELLIAGRVENKSTPIVVNGGDGAVWTVTS